MTYRKVHCDRQKLLGCFFVRHPIYRGGRCKGVTRAEGRCRSECDDERGPHREDAVAEAATAECDIDDVSTSSLPVECQVCQHHSRQFPPKIGRVHGNSFPPFPIPFACLLLLSPPPPLSLPLSHHIPFNGGPGITPENVLILQMLVDL